MRATSALDCLSPSLSSTPPLSFSVYLWRGDYGESDSWARVSSPPGLMGCGTVTLLKFLRVSGFGDERRWEAVRQRWGETEPWMQPETLWSRLKPAAAAAGLQQIKGRSGFLTECCRFCLANNADPPPPSSASAPSPAVALISGSAFDWWLRSGS